MMDLKLPEIRLPTHELELGDEGIITMGLGLSGCHRCGKTTVAALIAEANNAPFVRSSASLVAKEMGITVDAGMAFPVRLEYQERVLEVFHEDYKAVAPGSMFVADRTPLDLAAYVLCDWHPHVSDAFYDAWAADYVARCIELTSRYFFLVGVIQPGIPYKVEEGKPAPNSFYQEMVNNHILGLTRQDALSSFVAECARDMLSAKDRAMFIAKEYGHNVAAYKEELEERYGVQ